MLFIGSLLSKSQHQVTLLILYIPLNLTYLENEGLFATERLLKVY